MKKYYLLFLGVNLLAHPVSYTIDLNVSYNENKKSAEIICKSNSKNKCGLYNIKLLDKKGEKIAEKRFPFLKKSTLIKSEIKPYKLEFYLRKTPEHKYFKIFE
ncbi:hypothetical protein [Halarcobacter anaerophilus]|jgi:hypothetical protein|uniref:hypothetical protein n=1 Tax=Halarcobacter anaerophilus TaxID=877500 RepID=UPI0005C9836A|nr:hypothetical protein [Halarcobacter anaerophilus]